MNKNKSVLKSFKNAWCGLISPFKEERNLRFHFVIANLIVLFSYYFGISKLEWAVLIITISMVIAAELINTAIENAVDTATLEYSDLAKKAKDTAAGVVLFVAVISVIVGIVLFLDYEKIINTLTYIISTPKALIISLGLFIFDILFLIYGGRKKGK